MTFRGVLLRAWPLLLALACTRGGDRSAAASPSDTLRLSDALPAPRLPPADRVAADLAQLADSVSLGAWRRAHGDSLALGPRRPAFDVRERRCAMTVVPDPAVGPRALRFAVFYPPPAATPVVWPADTGAALRDAACRLGMLWVSIPVADEAAGARLADAIRAAIDKTTGPARPDPRMTFFGSAFWSHQARWKAGKATLVVALDKFAHRDTAEAGWYPHVVAFAFLPSSGVTVDLANPPDTTDPVPVESLSLPRALALAGLDSAAWAPLARALRAADVWEATAGAGVTMPPAATLTDAFRTWFSAAAPLPPPRRAAALFAADQALARTVCPFRLCVQRDSARLEPLRALGAEFRWSEPEREWLYGHSWLRQARALDPAGPVGRAVFLTLMRHGFDLSGTCAGGAEGFRQVIDEGETFLAGQPRAPEAPEVRFLVAEGYRDIVALAGGSGEGYADSATYRSQAPQAARIAADLYHAVVAAGDTTALARAAWREAFPLLAGIPPRGTHFFCVTD